MLTNLEWENANSLRNYPLLEGVSRRASNGLRLPLDALVDFVAFVPAGLDKTYYLSSVQVHNTLLVTFTVSGVQTGNQVGQFVLPALFSPLQSFDFFGVGLGVTGKAVIGSGMTQVQNWGVGVFTFESEQSQFEASVIVALETGMVTSVGIYNSTRVLVGDVKLVEGRVTPNAPNCVPGDDAKAVRLISLPCTLLGGHTFLAHR